MLLFMYHEISNIAVASSCTSLKITKERASMEISCYWLSGLITIYFMAFFFPPALKCINLSLSHPSLRQRLASLASQYYPRSSLIYFPWPNTTHVSLLQGFSVQLTFLEKAMYIVQCTLVVERFFNTVKFHQITSFVGNSIIFAHADLINKSTVSMNVSHTVCSRFDPFYIVSFYIKWAKTSWTCSRQSI